MYSIKFVQSLWIFYKRRKEGRDVRWFVAAALVIFALVTAVSGVPSCCCKASLSRSPAQRLTMDVSLVLEAQTAHTDVPGAAAAYYKTISTHRRLARTSIYVVLTLVSDAIIVRPAPVAEYRALTTLYPGLPDVRRVGPRLVHRPLPVPALPHRRRYAPRFPPQPRAAAHTHPGLAPWELWSLAQLQRDAPVMKAVIAYHVKYFYLVTLMLNLACTATIACRIWRVHRKAAAAGAGSMRFAGVLAAVVESGARRVALLRAWG